MKVQVIMRDGAPEYAVLPWDEYQALLDLVGRQSSGVTSAESPVALPKFATLSSLRDSQGLSQESLARSVGISPAYLDLIERAERAPDAAIRRALARAVGVPGWEGDA